MLLRGERPAFSASGRVTFHGGAAHPEGPCGPALGHSPIYSFEYLLAQIFGIGLQAPMMHLAQSHRNPLQALRCMGHLRPSSCTLDASQAPCCTVPGTRAPDSAPGPMTLQHFIFSRTNGGIRLVAHGEVVKGRQPPWWSIPQCLSRYCGAGVIATLNHYGTT